MRECAKASEMEGASAKGEAEGGEGGGPQPPSPDRVLCRRGREVVESSLWLVESSLWHEGHLSYGGPSGYLHTSRECRDFAPNGMLRAEALAVP